MNDIGRHNQERRDAWIHHQLRKLTRGIRLLDVGAGPRRYERACAANGVRYDAHDFPGWREFFPAAEPPQVESDICALPVADGAYDAVLCSEVLEHVPDPLAALRELVRVTHNGGVLILTAPFCSGTHFAPRHYCTGFSRHWYEYHLPRLGCTVLDIVPHGNFWDMLVQECERVPEIAGRYCLSNVAPIDLAGDLQDVVDRDAGSSEFMCWGWNCVARRD